MFMVNLKGKSCRPVSKLEIDLFYILRNCPVRWSIAELSELTGIPKVIIHRWSYRGFVKIENGYIEPNNKVIEDYLGVVAERAGVSI